MEGSPNKNYTIKDNNRNSSVSSWDILSNLDDTDRKELNDKLLNIADWQKSGRIDEARADHLRNEVTMDAQNTALQNKVRDYNIDEEHAEHLGNEVIADARNTDLQNSARRYNESQAENMYQNWHDQAFAENEDGTKNTQNAGSQDVIRQYNASQAENMYQNWHDQAFAENEDEETPSPSQTQAQQNIPSQEHILDVPTPEPQEVDQDAILDWLLGDNEKDSTGGAGTTDSLNKTIDSNNTVANSTQHPNIAASPLTDEELGAIIDEAQDELDAKEKPPIVPLNMKIYPLNKQDKSQTIDETIEARRAEETDGQGEALTLELEAETELNRSLNEQIRLEEELLRKNFAQQRNNKIRLTKIKEEREEISKLRSNLPNTTSVQDNAPNLQQDTDITPPPLNRDDLNAIIGETQGHDTNSEKDHQLQSQDNAEQAQNADAERQAAERKNYYDALLAIAHGENGYGTKVRNAEGFAKVFLDTENLTPSLETEYVDFWNNLSENERALVLSIAQYIKEGKPHNGGTTFIGWLEQNNRLN